MKKAKEILLLVGGIFQILGLIGFAIGGLVFVIISALKDFIVEALQNGQIHSDLPGTVEEQVAAIQIIFVTFGVIFFILALFNIIGVIVTFKARKSDSKKLLVWTIIFGVLGGTEVSAIGGVFGLIAARQQAKPAEAE